MSAEGPSGPAGGADSSGTAEDAAQDASEAPPDRIVLVGFMAAGKTTVGRLLARRLGYRFVDLDREVERRAGRPIPEIFREEGEARFRDLEAAVTRELDPEPTGPVDGSDDDGAGGRADRDAGRTGEASGGVVVAAGGGWMARPELRDRWPEAVRVWLRVEPRTVVERVGEEVEARPMLDPSDPLASARRLLEAREADYARAEAAVDTDDASPAEVAERVRRAIRAGTR